MTVSITGGYHCLSVTQLCNILFAIGEGIITYRDMRTYFAVTAMQASRDAAKRTGSKMTPQFLIEEIQELVGGMDEKGSKKSVRALEKAGLLEFSPSNVTFPNESIEGSQELLEEASGKGRSPKRLVPIPRRILRYLARCTMPSVAKSIIAYLIRGLSRRRDGTLNNKGSVKSSWIALITGISLRAAKAARRLLITLGWLTEDTSSSQQKLNRTGAYFEINTDWKEVCDQVEFAPPIAENGTEFAPLNKDRETLSDLKNQKTSAGASTSPYREPTLNDMQPGDLKRMFSVLVLYRQAVTAGWLNDSEANQLFFIATAIRVHRTNCNDPVRVFVAIIRRNLRSYITQAQEDSARQQLRNYREKQQRRRVENQVEDASQRAGFMEMLVTKVIRQLPRCLGQGAGAVN